MRVSTALVLAGCVAVAACASPEARRERAGGPGADVGNRPASVRMHGGSSQYHETPQVGVQHPSLDPAEHAKRTR